MEQNFNPNNEPYNQNGQIQQPQYNPYQNSGNNPNNFNQPPVQDFKVLNIIATVLSFLTCSFCCVGGILGIIGIVYSSKVETCNKIGDYNGAVNYSKIAKILMIITFSLIGLTLLSYIISAANGDSMGQWQMIMEEIEQLR